MPCILLAIALFFPRLLMLILWLFTNWFNGVFDSVLIPILGFLFLPLATLWYSVVVNTYGGQWSTINILVMVLAVAIDLGAVGGGYKRRRRG
jgi:hypothetical protein